MTKITIYVWNSAGSHCCEHVSARIEDEENYQEFYVDFFSRAPGSQEKELMPANTADESIVLYSTRDDLLIFTAKYLEKYSNDYSLYKNCADAVNDILDHFFPDFSAAQRIYSMKKIACCFFAVPCLGFSCVPAPCYISTPDLVSSKAKQILNSTRYANQLQEESQKLSTPTIMSMR